MVVGAHVGTATGSIPFSVAHWEVPGVPLVFKKDRWLREGFVVQLAFFCHST